jgi:hypothetical protein
MADLPVLNALEELQSSNKDGLKTLDKSFIKGFSELNTSLESMTNVLNKVFNIQEKMYEKARIENTKLIETMREDARQKDRVAKSGTGGTASESKGFLNLLKIGGLAAAAAGLATAVAEGYRGWEPMALAKGAKVSRELVGNGVARATNVMKNMGNAFMQVDTDYKNATRTTGGRITPAGSIANTFESIRSSVLNAFGKLEDVKDKFRVGRASVFASIGDTFNALRGNMYSAVGLGADGRAVVTTPEWVKRTRDAFNATKGFAGSAIDSIIDGVRNIFGSVKTFLEGPAGIISRGVQGMGTFLRKLPIIGTIVGAFMSTFEGIVAAFNVEGTFADKAQAFITTAISDFIGAPLDLFKNIISWVGSKFGFESFERLLDSFSFEDIFRDLLNTVFNMGRRTIEWFGTLFTNPEQALNELWDGIVGGVRNIGTWFKSLIPNDFDPLGYLGDRVKSILNWFYNSDTGDVFGGFLNIDLQKLKDSLPEFKLPEFDFPDFTLPDFPNPFEGFGQKIKNSTAFSAMNFGENFGIDMNFGDKIKNALMGVFGISPTSIAGAASASGGLTGAAVDRASRTNSSMGNIINVTPVTTNTNNQQQMNNTTVVPASPDRSRGSPIRSEKLNEVYS